MKNNPDSWRLWGRRLRNHLKQNHSSLAKLAELMVDENGNSKAESTLRSWTNGTREINLADFIEACSKAKADPAQILFGQPLMSEAVKKQIGALAVTVLETRPSRRQH